MKKILPFILLYCLLVTSIQSIALAGDSTENLLTVGTTKTSPTRDGLPLGNDEDSFLGYNYTTYNNFYYGNIQYNLNGDKVGSGFDERQFAWMAYLDYTPTLDQDKWTFKKNNAGEIVYAEGWENNFEDGDRVIFAIKFHNNAFDAYDGKEHIGGPGAGTSNETFIGVDLNNFTSPIGFIYSSRNVYYPNTSNPSPTGDTIKYKAGDYAYEIWGDPTGQAARTAADWMVLNPSPDQNMTLSFAKNENGAYEPARLLMGYDYNNNGDITGEEWFLENTDEGFSTEMKFIDEGTTETIQIPVETLNEITNPVTGNPDYPEEYEEISRDVKFEISNNKASLTFFDHPGCFKYSGWAFFEATIEVDEAPNYCESLEMTNISSDALCGLDPKSTVFTIDLTYALDPEEEFPQYVRIESGYPNSQILLSSTGQTYDLPTTVKINNQNEDVIEGTYFGTGSLYAQLVDENDIPITEEIIQGKSSSITVDIDCYDSISTCDNDCNDICITHPTTIPEGSYSNFSALTFDYYDNQWKDEILYMVENGYGEFYDTLADLKVDHPKAYPNPFGYEYCENLNLFEAGQIVINIISNAFGAVIDAPEADNNRIDTYDFRSSNTRGISSPPAYNEALPAPDTKTDSRFNNVLMALDFSTSPTALPISTGSFESSANEFESSFPTAEISTDDPDPGFSFEESEFSTDIDIDNNFEFTTPTDETYDPDQGGGFSVYDQDFKIDIPIPADTCEDPEDAFKANQGEQVYFYAAQPGTDVITVEGECTDETNCKETFSIIGIACNNLVIDPSSGNTCIEEDIPNEFEIKENEFEIKEIEFVTENGEPFTLSSEYTYTYTKWHTDDLFDGVFSPLDGNFTFKNPLETSYKEIKYIGDKTDVTTEVSKLGEISLSTTEACTKTYEPCPDIPPMCQDLTYEIASSKSDYTTFQTNPPQINYTDEEMYLIKSSTTYTPNKPDKTTDYKVKDESYGLLAIAVTPPAPLPPETVILPPESSWSPIKNNIPADKRMIFIPNPNLQPGNYQDIITIKSHGIDLETEQACLKSIDLLVPAENACKEIFLNFEPITPPGGEPPSTLLDIEGETGDYTGDFQFTVTGNGVYLSEDPIVVPDPKPQTLNVDLDTAKNTGVFMFGTTQETSWSASVTAIDEDPIVCTDSTSYTYIPPNVDPICQDLTIIEPVDNWVVNDDEEDFEITIQSDPVNHVWPIKWEATSSVGAPTFEHQTTTSKTNVLNNANSKTEVTISVPGQDDCIDTIEAYAPNQQTTENPSIKKYVKNGELDDKEEDANEGDWDTLINVQGQEEDSGKVPDESKYVTYKITFDPGKGKGVESVLIQEKSFETDGEIEGSQKGKLVFDQDEDEENLTIEVKENGNKKYLSYNEDELDICKYDDDGKLDTNKVCVSLQDYEDFVDNKEDIEFQDLINAFADDDEGLIFNNIDKVSKIRIYYQMENKTKLDKTVCKELNPATDGCGEKFINEAYFEAFKNNDPDIDDDDPVKTGDDDTEVIAICQFIITRAAGDVFFNSPLATGIDVAFCSEQKNIQGPTIKGILPNDPTIVSTGSGDGELGGKTFLTTPTHDICKYSNVEGTTEGIYNNPLENFSSTICEMEAEVAEVWQKEYIVNQINANISKLTKWYTGSLGIVVDNHFPTPDQNIYSWIDEEVTINELEISADNPPLTQTYVIRNGDLNINGNIEYKLDTSILGAFILKQFPSAAFIVIDGDINIHEDVDRLDGVFIAIDTDDTDGIETGKINSKDNEISYNQLTINGIMVGDVSNLFEQRRYVGNISNDEGSVTIKFSENFLLNTPPGLSELLDLTQLRVAY